MKKYIVRSLKYFVAICVLCMAMMGLMFMTGYAQMSPEQTFYAMLHTDRFLLLLCALAVLAAFYPKFGFVRRYVDGDVVKNREQIINAMRTAGFSLCSEQNGVMTFRADNVFKKFMMLWEDKIEISQSEGAIMMDGIRRAVARAAYRLDSYIDMTRND